MPHVFWHSPPVILNFFYHTRLLIQDGNSRGYYTKLILVYVIIGIHLRSESVAAFTTGMTVMAT